MGFEIEDQAQLDSLLAHLHETTSRIENVKFKDIYFLKNREEFILFLECDSEEDYLSWREICPPPPGARDWYESLLTKEENFVDKKGDK